MEEEEESLIKLREKSCKFVFLSVLRGGGVKEVHKKKKKKKQKIKINMERRKR